MVLGMLIMLAIIESALACGDITLTGSEIYEMIRSPTRNTDYMNQHWISPLVIDQQR